MVLVGINHLYTGTGCGTHIEGGGEYRITPLQCNQMGLIHFVAVGGDVLLSFHNSEYREIDDHLKDL